MKIAGFVSRKTWGPQSVRFEAALAATGLTVIALCLISWGHAALFQAVHARRLAAAGVERIAAAGAESAAGRTRAAAAAGGVLGIIELPRLGLSAVIGEGVDRGTLSVAVGHVPGTAFPGEPGNVAMSAHRDTFFRGLRDVVVADTVRIRTFDGSFLYRVDSTSIVMPDGVDVLAPTLAPTLTLITCYPFRYIGPAPKRFIVRARLIT